LTRFKVLFPDHTVHVVVAVTTYRYGAAPDDEQVLKRSDREHWWKRDIRYVVHLLAVFPP